MRHTYTKHVFAVYLKFRLNWASCILSAALLQKPCLLHIMLTLLSLPSQSSHQPCCLYPATHHKNAQKQESGGCREQSSGLGETGMLIPVVYLADLVQTPPPPGRCGGIGPQQPCFFPSRGLLLPAPAFTCNLTLTLKPPGQEEGRELPPEP